MNRLRQLVQAIFDRPFGLVTVVYIIVVFAAWHFRWSTPGPDRNYIAARELVNNHRLTSADLKAPADDTLGFYMETKSSIEGKYVRTSTPIARGKSISRAAIADQPDMQIPDKFAMIAFPMTAGSVPIGALDAGSNVVLLGQDADTKDAARPADTKAAPSAADTKSAAGGIEVRATVHAIYCEPKKGDAPNCYALLRIPADKIQSVAKNQSTLHVALPSQAQP